MLFYIVTKWAYMIYVSSYNKIRNEKNFSEVVLGIFQLINDNRNTFQGLATGR